MTNSSNIPGPAYNAVLDFEVLKSFEKVKSDDGSDIVIELIDLYLKSIPQRLFAIRRAAAKNDWASLKREAHTLKGSSSTLGLHQISRACQNLEQACSNVLADVETFIRLLELKFLEAKPALIAERNRRCGPQATNLGMRSSDTKNNASHK